MDSSINETRIARPEPVEASASKRKRWTEVLLWWPVLLPPIGITAVCGVYAIWEVSIAKADNELAAMILMPIAVGVFAFRWLLRRDRLHLVLTVFAAALLCREIHFTGTHKGIYVAMALVGVWCYLWRRPLLRQLLHTRKGRWLTMAAWAYFVALLVQRRALRGVLPFEQILHSQIEETLENIAHALLIVSGLV